MKYVYTILTLTIFAACSTTPKGPSEDFRLNISVARPGIHCGQTGRQYYSNGVNAYCQHPREDAPNQRATGCRWFVGKPAENFGGWCGVNEKTGKRCDGRITLDECREILEL